jgi:hypothetical protein
VTDAHNPKSKIQNLKYLLLALLLAGCDFGLAPDSATPIPPPGPTATGAAAAPTATPAAGPASEEVYLRIAAAEASSFDSTPGFSPSPDAMNAADGDRETRWAPRNGADNQWIRFDFGGPKTMDHIVIYWEEAFATAYDIQVSDDDATWRTVVTANGQDGGQDEFRFAPATARYVRVNMRERKFAEWGTSIWEFEAYGSAAANPGDRPYAEVFAARATPTALPLEPPAAGLGPWGARELHKGVNYTSYTPDELAAPVSDETLRYLAANGVNSLGIVVTWYQTDMSSTEIAPWSGKGGRSVSDGALAHAINLAHSLGMRVMLKPHLDLKVAESRTNLTNPPAAWFDSYRAFITHYATLAKTYNVELFCLGTELDGTIPGHEAEWAEVIQAARAAYPGQLTYAANWPSYQSVPFWQDLDYIGIDAYFPVTNTPNPDAGALAAGWQQIAGAIDAWRTAAGLAQPVLLTELGYRSAVGSNMQFSAPFSDEPAPEQQQAALQAALTVLPAQPWFQGLYYWNYLPDRAPPDPAGYLLAGKPGEATLFAGFAAWPSPPPATPAPGP